ncbi:bifunctional 3-(3-hydroxy-phenyl)propionate/3-hydroxycinnamic acid hydroxylase [Embleya sp. NPDC059237]|uniref:bifunctional 3-(3-hydroxy-phenyl)propionate/3-hydroxycinnamic acid hydroxylase MhpA n=1 Tax=Embleya sp. NPDC059237 TaxID=3346784 RepID=UPI003685CE95
MDIEYDVAIVGYGPSGLVLASALGKAGHKVVVFERWPSLYGLPRLTHIDGETARVIASVGDVEHALRDARPVTNYRYLDGAGEELIELDWRGESCGYPAHISMYQPDIEDAIDRHVRASGNVDVHQGWSVVHLLPFDDHVEVTARPWSQSRTGQWSHSDEERTITAKYLVGADGANSFVRATSGIERSDNGVDDRWLNIDTEQVRELPDRFAGVTQFCDPGRGHMYMPIGRSRQRFELAVLDGEDQARFEEPEFAWTWLRTTHGLGPEDVRILRQVVYTFQGRIAETWRRGRVFLIGDAAHTTPPYIGQGACSGMRDGITLGWKLDLVLRGLAGDRLLDTYEAERRPHATAITEISTALGRVANTHDPVAAAVRDAAFRTGDVPDLPPFPTLVAGVVHHAADGTVGPAAGTLTPHGPVRTAAGEGLFDDVVGRGFSLVSTLDRSAVLDTGRRSFLDALGVRTATLAPGAEDSVEDVAGTYTAWLAERGAEALIGRPDHHLFWAGTLADLPEALDQLRARLAWTGSPAPVGALA